MKTHRNVTPRQEALAERQLFVAVAALKTPEEVRAFFRDLCTPAELQAMADRWAVVEFLQKGVPYREIHRLTGVSVTTIGRVARCLIQGNGGYVAAAQRLEEAKGVARKTDGKANGKTGGKASGKLNGKGNGNDPGNPAHTANQATARRAEAARHG